MISAKVIAHSTYEGASVQDELITMEVEFHRFILAEINTHRVLSRNYQSSRAVPVEKLLQQVRDNPAIPVHWGKNQRGMVADNELQEGDKCSVATIWEQSARIAANQAEIMYEQGLHKQVVNRILEPFVWTRGVITATRGAWESVFALRCHPDAQPEFQALACKIREAVNASIPTMLGAGQWHLPYVEWKSNNAVKDWAGVSYYSGNEIIALQDAIKISTSCCAQVSYRTLDDSLEKALKIYDMLNLPEGGVLKEAPAHMSPCEHQACVGDFKDLCNPDEEYEANTYNGNFGSLGMNGWRQHRKILEKGIEHEFIKQ